MLRTINIQTPNGLMEVSGQCYNFKIGHKTIKFMVNLDPWGQASLTHYKSGLKIGSISAIKVREMINYLTPTDRSAAQIIIDELIEKHGLDRVLVKFTSAQTINKG